MKGPIDTNKFLKIALDAFPYDCRSRAEEAAVKLIPFLVGDYRSSSEQIVVRGKTVSIPKRLHFHRLEELLQSLKTWDSCTIDCLCTRSTDGYFRRKALKRVVATCEPWVIPYVVLLAGEYVVEITEDLFASVTELDQQAYKNFVLENRPLMGRSRSRAASYWDCYHRARYPDRSVYPGLAFLHQLERWAS